MLKQGAGAPDFELAAADESRLSLKEILASGPAVIAFFKTTCPVCQYAFPFLERLHRNAGGKLRFYAISQDPAPATGYFLSDYGISFPALLDTYDSGYAASNAYGIRSVPSVFVIEPDGTISAAMEGFEKIELEALGERIGTPAFAPDEDVPVFRPG